MFHEIRAWHQLEIRAPHQLEIRAWHQLAFVPGTDFI
jgi:hypothetical protein